MSAWSIAPISTRGAMICASIATAAADSPSASCRRRASSTGSIRRIHPRLAVGGDRRRGSRRGRLRRGAAARTGRVEPASVVEVAIERGHLASSPPSRRGWPSTARSHNSATTLSAVLGLAHDRRGDVALVVAAICFGSTFIVVQGAVERVEPIPFLAVRFLIAAVVLWLIARRRPVQPARAARRHAGRRRPAARLRAADHGPPVHELGHLGVHHLPPGRVRAAPRLRAPRSATRTR